jgi:hypothetical protein
MDKCAFDIGGAKCAALKKRACSGCAFRQTEEELRAGREKASARIGTLPEAQQDHINMMYYCDYNRAKWEGDFNDKRRKHKTACAY